MMRSRKHRIGLLAYGLDRQLSGVTRVALELGTALAAHDDWEVVYLTTYRQGPFRGPGWQSAYLPGCERLPALMALGGPLLEILARRFGLDLIHDPIGIAPFTVPRALSRYKRVLTLHDAIAFRYPEGYPWLNNFLHRRYIPSTLRNVDAVLTVSQHAAEDLAHFLPLPAGQLFVVPNGVSTSFRPASPEHVRRAGARYNLDRPYILSVAAHQARKNVATLLEAFVHVHARYPELLLALAGPTLWDFPEHRQHIERLGLTDAVRVLGYVADEDLAAVYTGALAFAFPSLYEGFGLPVLEAMACGTPVVCADASSLPEVAGDAARLVPATDILALGNALLAVLDHPSETRELQERGLKRAARYSWQDAARRTTEIYGQVLSQ